MLRSAVVAPVASGGILVASGGELTHEVTSVVARSALVDIQWGARFMRNG
jgi:hypothetical protein